MAKPPEEHAPSDPPGLGHALTGVWTLRLLPLAAVVSLPVSSAAQVVSGSVVEDEGGRPVAGAAVMQVGPEGGALLSTETDRGGRFHVRPRGTPPFTLHVRRYGYLERTVSLEEPLLRGGELEVRLVRDPLILRDIEVESERNRVDFRASAAWRITDRGFFMWGDLTRPCRFIEMDSIVVRDWRLLKDTRSYEPARYIFHGPAIWAAAEYEYPGRPVRHRSGGPDPRVVREAWPCAPRMLGYYNARDRFRERRLPVPAVPEVEIRVDVQFRIQALDIDPRRVAVSDDGDWVVALFPSLAQIQRLSPEGEKLEEIDLAPSGLEGVTHVVVRGQTVWMSDRRAGRVAGLYSGKAAPELREMTADRPPGTWTLAALEQREGQAREAPPVFHADLPVPVPLRDGRWLWTVPLHGSARGPPGHEFQPARLLLSLEEGWERSELLGVLDPGPEPALPGVAGPASPLHDYPLVALAPDGSHLTLIDRRLEMGVLRNVFAVTRLTPKGDTVFRVERPAPMVRVSDRAFVTLADEAAAESAIADAVSDPGLRRALVRKAMYRATYHPPVTAVAGGRDGTTWLRWPDVGEEMVRWEVLGPEGDAIRTLKLDRRAQVVDADGDSVWALVRPSPTEARLVRYRMVPP